ncbi:hypothetical protein BC351_10325 [Paenibacillus ferrarius]|uniref:Uncharacterized protein n=1 Tax=Paenibacillus ferrarius TaxID=1469647 RepID=A0A1V4H998_9BACL|nr:hypothetical protein [Paenibacillus ferrarius]OPH47579.1 hypothetical protein BC351_10325 [Paenibacillus ferrarius]
MATVGQTLSAPETGWKRYEETDSSFTYAGASWQSNSGAIYSGNSAKYTLTPTLHSVKFNFTGSKIRIISYRGTDRNSAITLKIDDVAYTYSANGSAQNATLLFEKIDLVDAEHNVEISVSDATGQRIFEFDAIDIDSNKTIKLYKTFSFKILVLSNGYYRKFNGTSWEVVSATPTETDYLNNGMDDISTIPESAWSQLTGIVEIDCWTDNFVKAEVQFNFETNPFTLADVWEGKSIEVLCYTDDPLAGNQNMKVSMNVTGRRNLIKNIPNPTILAYNTNPNTVVNGSMSGIPKDRYYKYKVTIDDTSTPNNPDDILSDWSNWKTTNTDTSVTVPAGYVHKLNPYNIKVEAQQLDNKIISSIGQVLLFNQSPVFIMGAISYNTLSVTLDDPDGDTIQYQILLNGKVVTPEDGGWSPPQTVPFPIVYKFDTTDVLIGKSNTCTINVKDEFGVVATLTLTFTGDYNGIMFSDASGSYYSTDSGAVIKQLDFGMLVAGFNSDIATIRIVNKNYFPVKNIELSFDKSKIAQYTDVKMSKYSGDSFLDSDTLIYDNVLKSGEYVEIYIRIKTQMFANGGSLFKINAKANISV